MRYLLFLFALLFCCQVVHGRVADNPATKYGISMPDSATMAHLNAVSMAETISGHPMLATARIISEVNHPHPEENRTIDFYLLLVLCIVLGVIRFVDVRYFLNIWTAFWNPTLSNRQLKDQIEDAGLPEFLMNIFFSVVIGTYLFYFVRHFTAVSHELVSAPLLILLLIFGVGVIYLVKYTAVRFCGWAFRMEAITEHYLFNVFLINKILAVALLPFVIVFAFADKHVVDQMIYVSMLLGGVLILNRYLRSWQLFGAFFQNSKFHFFMYLCASELLPLAVLIKFLVNWL